MENVKVKNMLSSRGNKIANQFEIISPEGIYFQSYKSIIALKIWGSRVRVNLTIVIMV